MKIIETPYKLWGNIKGKGYKNAEVIIYYGAITP